MQYINRTSSSLTLSDLNKLRAKMNYTMQINRRKNLWRSMFFAALAVIALQWVIMARAQAHSWYPYECCSDKDCEAIPPETVQVTPSGYLWAGILIPYDEARVSMDKDYHVCRGVTTGIMIQPWQAKPCFFAPTGAS